MEKCAKNFGKKEKVLNYACQLYQLTRPRKVGAVMSLIREYQPESFEQWKEIYFKYARTENNDRSEITIETLSELGERLYAKITEFVIPDWESAFRELTLQDCIDYIYDVTVNRTYDGFLTEKSVVNDGLAKIFPDLVFEESDPKLDHAGDVDYVAWVGKKALGIQIKPTTISANISGFSLTERMRASFDAFERKYGGKVFIVYSVNKRIANPEVIDQIRAEIIRLSRL